MKTIKQFIPVILGILLGGGILLGTANAVSILQPQQGGTGISTSTAGNVGKALIISSINPLVYGFGNAGGGTSSVTINQVTTSTFIISCTSGCSVTTSTDSTGAETIAFSINAGGTGNTNSTGTANYIAMFTGVNSIQTSSIINENGVISFLNNIEVASSSNSTSTPGITIGTGANSSTLGISIAGKRANIGYDPVRANMYLQAGTSIGALKGIDFIVGGDGSTFPSGTIALTLGNTGNATFNKNVTISGLSSLQETKLASTTNTGNFTNTGNISNTGTFAFTGYSSNPQLFAADSTTGIHFDAPGIVSFHNGGNQTMLLSSTNRVGIGNFAPTAYLTILPTSTAAATNYDLLTISSSSGILYLNVSSTGQTYIKELNTPSTTVSGTLNAGTLQQGGTGVVLTTRNVNTNAPLGGGGALSGDLTLTCTTCVTSVTAGTGITSSGGTTPAITNIGVTSLASSSPITVSNATGSVTVSCATCVTSVTGGSGISSTGGTTPVISASSSFASSSVSINIYDATTTAPYGMGKWRVPTGITIDTVSCDEFAAATSTVTLYQTTALASVANAANIVTGLQCGITGNTTTTFNLATLNANDFIIASTTATAGTPSWTTVNIHFKKN